MNWLSRIVVLSLIMNLASPLFADNRATAAQQRAAAAQRNQQQRLALTRSQAMKRQIAQSGVGSRASAKKSAPKNKLGTTMPHTVDQNNFATKLLLGALIVGLATDGGGFHVGPGNVPDQEEARDRQRRYNKEYWQDRARRDADAGNYDEAKRSLENAK